VKKWSARNDIAADAHELSLMMAGRSALAPAASTAMPAIWLEQKCLVPKL